MDYEPVRTGPPLAARLDRVAHSYTSNSTGTLFHNVCLEVEPGEQVAIIGSSGAGKSTLLGILAGRIKPMAGKVECEGTATIYQDLRLVPQRTTFQNIQDGTLGSENSGSLAKAETNLIRNLIRKVGLEGKEDTLVSKLSGGERQRVAVARALMQAPSVILADEPVAALDRRSAQRVMKILSDLCREQEVALICVLHDERLATEFFDSSYVLENGRLGGVELSQLTGRMTQTLLMPERDGLESKPTESTTDRTYLLAMSVFLASILPIFLLDFGGLSFFEIVSNVTKFFGQVFTERIGDYAKVPYAQLFRSLWETVLMAIMATGLATLITLPVSAFAAGNTGLKQFNRVVRLLLNFLRTVPSIIWALLFVAAIGLGPLAGVLALTAYSVGYIGKFFYEAFELVEPGPVEALKEIGASPSQTFRRAIWPQAVPAVIGHFLFMLEYNIRSASVLGVVDAGGIGFYLKQYMDLRFFPAVLVGLSMIFVLVVLVDLLSAQLRKAYLPNRAC